MSGLLTPDMTSLLAKLRQAQTERESQADIDALEGYLKDHRARLAEKDKDIAALTEVIAQQNAAATKAAAEQEARREQDEPPGENASQGDAESTAATEPKVETLIEKNALFYEAEDGKATAGPYCPRCHVKDGLRSHLTRIYPGNIERCPICGTEYQRLQLNGVPKVGGS